MTEDRKFSVYLDKDCECIRIIVLNTKFSFNDTRALQKALQDAQFEFADWKREQGLTIEGVR